MEKLLVYLHGFGFDSKEHLEFTETLANSLNANTLFIDAPFESKRERGGYAWCNLSKDLTNDAFDEKLDFSMQYIIKKTEEELENLNLNWNNVIICGRSQGAYVAMHMIFNELCKPNFIISLCSYYPQKYLEQGIKEKNTPILWVEAKNDIVVNTEKKRSYKELIAQGCNLTYILNEKSEHDYLDSSIIKQLLNVIN